MLHTCPKWPDLGDATLEFQKSYLLIQILLTRFILIAEHNLKLLVLHVPVSLSLHTIFHQNNALAVMTTPSNFPDPNLKSKK